MSFCTVVGRLVRTVNSGCRVRWSPVEVQARSGMTAAEVEKAIRWLRRRDLVKPVWGHHPRFKLTEAVDKAWRKSSLACARAYTRDTNVVSVSMSERSERITQSEYRERARRHARARSENITKVVHCKRDKFDVYIGRPSQFCNPYKIGLDGSRETVIRKYKNWLFSKDGAVLRATIQRELRGKVLGCWCYPKLCHGDVIAEVANEVTPWSKIFENEIQSWSGLVSNEVLFELLEEYPTRKQIHEAKKLHYVYQLAIESKKSRYAPISIQQFEDLSIGYQGFLIRGAELAQRLGVTYRRFVSAQFWWFEKFDRDKRGYVKLPQLNQLVGQRAAERVQEYTESLEEDHDRKASNRTIDAAQSDHSRETRKLSQLRKLLGLGTKEVLRLVPTDFSRKFLEHHGVWSDVGDSWIAESD